MEASNYIEIWQSLYDQVMATGRVDLPNTRAEIANVILQEMAKDRRMATIRAPGAQAPTAPALATEKQKTLMDQLKLPYTMATTKFEAHKQIEAKLSTSQ